MLIGSQCFGIWRTLTRVKHVSPRKNVEDSPAVFHRTGDRFAIVGTTAGGKPCRCPRNGFLAEDKVLLACVQHALKEIFKFGVGTLGQLVGNAQGFFLIFSPLSGSPNKVTVFIGRVAPFYEAMDTPG